MELRGKKIRAWFEMWLRKSDEGVEDLFSSDAVNIESWGPEYHGLEKVRHWFSGGNV